MASANEIDDLLQCPICLETFYNPKVLDCQHTFCAQCLKVHLSRVSRPNHTIDCPLCRRQSNLIQNSIDSLPTNYIVADIIERKYGRRSGERTTSYLKQVEDRLKKFDQKKEEKEEQETDYMEYVKPAVAALVGVLGGLLLAKGVKKWCDKKDDR